MDLFLTLLTKRMEDIHGVIAYQLVRYMADIIDYHPVWRATVTHALDLPISRGPKRAKAIHPFIIQAVVREAARGRHGKSARQIADNLQRFASKTRFCPKTANSWTDSELGTRAWSRWSLLRSVSATYFSIASDATRLGNLDCLWLALGLPEHDTSLWLPQQAPMSI